MPSVLTYYSLCRLVDCNCRK